MAKRTDEPRGWQKGNVSGAAIWLAELGQCKFQGDLSPILCGARIPWGNQSHREIEQNSSWGTESSNPESAAAFDAKTALTNSLFLTMYISIQLKLHSASLDVCSEPGPTEEWGV